MKKIGFLAVAGLILLTAFTGVKHEDPIAALKNGDKAPKADVSMKATDGKEYTLKSLNGKKGLVVVFSCNTCPFVVGSESFGGWEVQYNALHEMANKEQVGFVLVNSNEAKRTNDDSMEEMVKRAAQKGYTMPYVVDEKSALANAFGAKTTPHVYFFNENLELIYQGAIDNSTDSKRESDVAYLRNAVTEHAAGKSITVATSVPRGCSIKRVAHAH